MMKPKLDFYKFLAKWPDLKKVSNFHERTLHMWVPDTIVYNDGANQPYWIYTGEDGIVRKTEDFTDKEIISKFANQFKLDELVCIARTVRGESNYGVQTADVEVLNARDIVQKIP